MSAANVSNHGIEQHPLSLSACLVPVGGTDFVACDFPQRPATLIIIWLSADLARSPAALIIVWLLADSARFLPPAVMLVMLLVLARTRPHCVKKTEEELNPPVFNLWENALRSPPSLQLID